MRNSYTFALVCCIVSALAGPETARAQIGGGGGGGAAGVQVFAVNNSGFVQTGLNGPDNLVLFEFPTMAPMDPPPPIEFTVIGNLQSDLDQDGDGALDSLGTFSGLEWSSGMPGGGTLIGCVLNGGNGAGELYRIDPSSADTVLIGQAPIVDGIQRDFSDLAFNLTDGLMYGLMNNLTPDGNGNLDVGPNTLWFDTDGDLIPDTSHFIVTDGGVLLATFANGLTFLDGLVYVYDNLDEAILLGGADSSLPADSFAGAFAFDDGDTGLNNSLVPQGNGLGTAGRSILISTDVAGRNTVTSFIEIPDPIEFPLEFVSAGFFGTEFFQTGFQAVVAPGDLVAAFAPPVPPVPTFPSTLLVNRGVPAADAILEGIVLSDDFRYCITAQAPLPTEAPVDVTVVFTIAGAPTVTALGFEVESNVNTTNVAHTFSVVNVNTQQFEIVGSENVTINEDSLIVVDLTSRIADFLNPATGQLILRISSAANGPSLTFPWQIKFDSIAATSN